MILSTFTCIIMWWCYKFVKGLFNSFGKRYSKWFKYNQRALDDVYSYSIKNCPISICSVMAWAQGQLRINFFKFFTILQLRQFGKLWKDKWNKSLIAEGHIAITFSSHIGQNYWGKPIQCHGKWRSTKHAFIRLDFNWMNRCWQQK